MPTGTPIPSPVDGQVTKNDSNKGNNGNRVSVYDPKTGIEHHFLHMESQSELKEGEAVKKGETIGYSGNTGSPDPNNPYGPHVHYETRDKNGGKYPDNVTQPKQEDIDYLDKHFTDIRGCK